MRDLTPGRGAVVAAAVAVFENKEPADIPEPQPRKEQPQKCQQQFKPIPKTRENPSKIDENIENSLRFKAQEVKVASPRLLNKTVTQESIKITQDNVKVTHENIKSTNIENVSSVEIKTNVKIESVKKSVMQVSEKAEEFKKFTVMQESKDEINNKNKVIKSKNAETLDNTNSRESSSELEDAKCKRSKDKSPPKALDEFYNKSSDDKLSPRKGGNTRINSSDELRNKSIDDKLSSQKFESLADKLSSQKIDTTTNKSSDDKLPSRNVDDLGNKSSNDNSSSRDLDDLRNKCSDKKISSRKLDDVQNKVCNLPKLETKISDKLPTGVTIESLPSKPNKTKTSLYQLCSKRLEAFVNKKSELSPPKKAIKPSEINAIEAKISDIKQPALNANETKNGNNKKIYSNESQIEIDKPDLNRSETNKEDSRNDTSILDKVLENTKNKTVILDITKKSTFAQSKNRQRNDQMDKSASSKKPISLNQEDRNSSLKDAEDQSVEKQISLFRDQDIKQGRKHCLENDPNLIQEEKYSSFHESDQSDYFNRNCEVNLCQAQVKIPKSEILNKQTGKLPYPTGESEKLSGKSVSSQKRKLASFDEFPLDNYKNAKSKESAEKLVQATSFIPSQVFSPTKPSQGFISTEDFQFVPQTRPSQTQNYHLPPQPKTPPHQDFLQMKYSPFGRTQELTTTEVATILLNKVKKNAALNGKLEEDSGEEEEHDARVTKISVCPGDPDYSQYHRSVGDEEDKGTCCAFESAVKDFDMTAEDVQKFVAESMRSIANDKKKVELRRDSDGKSESAPSEDTSETSDEDDLISETTDYSEDCMIREGLATIAEEVTASSVHSSDDDEDGSSEASTSPDEDGTVKGNQEKWCNGSVQTGSSSDMSSTSSERTTNLKDSSTRCNGDFQWSIPKEKKPEDCIPLTKPPINRNRERTPRRSVEKTPPGSLDRRRHNHNQQNRQERDQKSRSSHVLKSPPRLEDFIGGNGPCKNWCCSPHPHQQDYYFDFHRRHERMDPQRYGSNPMLMDRFCERGSHPDLYRHESMGCSCAYHMPPPPCYYYGGDGRGYHWTPSKPPDQDERTRKLQAERDNLQLQVQVLTEQIEAQGDKIGDLEKNLNEKKQQLNSQEDLLQREMLSRSSLETQKLELMTTISELKLQQAALERENMELKSTVQMNNNSIDGIKKPPFLPRTSPQPTLTSTPVHGSNQTLRKSPSPSPVTINSSGTSPRRVDSSTQEVQSPKTPPANYRRQIELQYASLPRQQFLSNGGSALSVVDSNANPANGVRKGVAFGMGLSSLLGGRARGQSVPNLADTEKIVIDEPNGDTPQSPSVLANKNKGIKKIFGKIKRSGSGNLEDFGMSCGEFQRGGVRATASARLGWSEPIPTIKPDKPFAEWDTENICDWLQDLGLDQYVPDAKKWVKSGQQLLEASMTEIEKELVIKNPLHRKKLQLALIDTEENSSSDPFLPKAGKLDTAWVLRWLDDTGLPQYKETFLLNRIDGRVLHRLTMDDLALLHVTSMLHVSSIKRGIQVLRENNYEAGCLQRRSLPDDPETPTPKQVSLWTTHRVMEWLRAVDLAEYAPNLRGAGVHGGLLVHENKFTAELLAALLSIPSGKTLLRRHLNTHFNALLGKDIIQAKREAESTLGYVPLTPASKVKIAKKSHFSLKRNKSKSEADYGDLVCPLNQNSGENCQNGSTINNSMGMMKMSAKDEVAYLAEEEYFSSSSTSSPLLTRHN